MNKPIVILAVIVGIIFVIVAIIYFLEPARALPQFFPGYDSKLSQHHYKHGIGSLLLGLACFAFGWFQSGKKSTKQENN